MSLSYATVLGAPHVSAQDAWQYGVLGVVALVFGYAILHLWRTSRADLKSMEAERLEVAKDRSAERAAWQIERHNLHTANEIKLAELRAEHEERHRELVEDFAKELRADRDASRAHEDQARREFAELMERVSDDSVKSAEKIAQMLQKFYDRFVGPRGRY